MRFEIDLLAHVIEKETEDSLEHAFMSLEKEQFEKLNHVVAICIMKKLHKANKE